MFLHEMHEKTARTVALKSRALIFDTGTVYRQYNCTASTAHTVASLKFLGYMMHQMPSVSTPIAPLCSQHSPRPARGFVSLTGLYVYGCLCVSAPHQNDTRVVAHHSVECIVAPHVQCAVVYAHLYWHLHHQNLCFYERALPQTPAFAGLA